MADFITKLPLAQGYNSILVVVDRLTKMVHFIPTTEKNGTLHTYYRENVSRGTSKVVQGQHIEIAWVTGKYHIRPGTTIHGRINKRAEWDVGDNK